MSKIEELLGLDGKSFDALVYSVADTIDDVIDEESFCPRINRKYANKRKHLLKDKQNLLAYETEDKSILTDEGVFYGKMLQGWKARSAFHGKKFIGMTQKEYWNHDYKYVTSRIDNELKLRMDTFAIREALSDANFEIDEVSLIKRDPFINKEPFVLDFWEYAWRDEHELDFPGSVDVYKPSDLYWEEPITLIYNDYIRDAREMNYSWDEDEYEYWDNY